MPHKVAAAEAKEIVLRPDKVHAVHVVRVVLAVRIRPVAHLIAVHK